MKSISQKSKKGYFVIITAICAAYCLYLVVAGLSGGSDYSTRCGSIRTPLLLKGKTAHPNDRNRWRDSTRRRNYR